MTKIKERTIATLEKRISVLEKEQCKGKPIPNPDIKEIMQLLEESMQLLEESMQLLEKVLAKPNTAPIVIMQPETPFPIYQNYPAIYTQTIPPFPSVTSTPVPSIFTHILPQTTWFNSQSNQQIGQIGCIGQNFQ